jgi:hypothetical protein
MTVKGLGGEIMLFDYKVTIKRGKAEKDILLTDISAVELKPKGFLSTGFIWFAFVGGREEVAFKKRGSDFAQLKTEIERRILERRAGAIGVQRPATPMDELSQLADLRARGVINDKEFERKKKELLATPSTVAPQVAAQFVTCPRCAGDVPISAYFCPNCGLPRNSPPGPKR